MAGELHAATGALHAGSCPPWRKVHDAAFACDGDTRIRADGDLVAVRARSGSSGIDASLAGAMASQPPQ